MLFETLNPDLTMEAAALPQIRPRLPAAIEAGTLEYQPIIALQDGAVRGLAAVLRRRRPGSSASATEQRGWWTLAHACVEARYWPGCRMSVTVSARRLDGELLEQVEAALAMSGLAASQFDIELTGTGQIEAFGVLQALRERGVGIVLGDFGTTGAGLSLLRELPLTAIKFGRSLVRNLPLSPDARASARASLAAAHAMGLVVIAEAEETLSQRDFLIRIGCDEAQGSIYSRPLPPDRLAALLDYGVDTCSKPRSGSETLYDRAVPH